MKPTRIPILLAALYAGTLAAPAQQPGAPGDPFIKGNQALIAAPAVVDQDGPSECLVRMEVFALSPAEARRVMRQFPKQADLYAWLGVELEKPNATVKLEHLTLLRVRSGQRSKLEQIAELPYPTEFDPPQIPQSIGIGLPVQGGTTTTNVTNNPPPAPVPKPPVTPTPPAPPAPPPGAQGDPGAAGAPAAVIAPGSMPASLIFGPWPYTTTTPSSFAYKNLGWTAEIELTIGEDGRTVDLNLAPELVRFCGLNSQPPNGEIVQAVFETSRISGQMMTTLGQPALAGTFSPPVATGVPGGNQESFTRLLFITVTDPR